MTGAPLGCGVVLGGSLAGLLAARVLADHADEVVIVERDRISEASGLRRGVPQARHLHGLLKRGELVLDRLFPGLSKGLRDAGAVPVRFCADVRWYHHGQWKLQTGDAITATFMTRPFLEDEVRVRALAYPRIRVLEEHVADGLLATTDGSAVTGVRCRPAGSGGGRRDAGSTLEADLVVDATGRGSRAEAWLGALGYQAPPSSTVGINVGYSSQLLHLRDLAALGAKAMIVVPAPEQCTRAAALMPMEGNRWLCSAAGFVGDHPPKDRNGLLRFLGALPTPALHDAVHDAEPLGPVAHARFAENRWVRYERARRLPDRFVVIGDAAGCFNPVYGQGMTAAALAAEALDRSLLQPSGSASRNGLTRGARREIAKAIKNVWMMSASEDLNYPGVEGSRPPGHAAVRWYLRRVHAATATDPAALEHFVRVGHMLEPTPALMRPGYALRVLRASRAGPSRFDCALS